VITPSLAESFSLVTLEALCCGTPVVAFSVGGIPDLIDHKLNGYLAKYRDVEDLTKGVLYCLQNNVKGYMLPMFEPELTIKKHLELSNYLLLQNNKSI
jgi:glycosyltransferase involved in cell wall biosynthesis